jgi:hypothetical protein
MCIPHVTLNKLSILALHIFILSYVDPFQMFLQLLTRLLQIPVYHSVHVYALQVLHILTIYPSHMSKNKIRYFTKYYTF